MISPTPALDRKMRSRSGLLLLICLAAAAARPAWAEERLTPTVTSWRLTDETWQLPQGEAMGMVGGSVLLQAWPGLKVGVASYGAVRGHRGGFITLGLAAEGRWAITQDWAAEAGAFVGGGGGRGGATLAGGGLMLRSHAGLSYNLRSWGHPSGRLGLGVSMVDFPSGVVRSRQPYLSYEHDFNALVSSGWPSVSGMRSESSSVSSWPVRPQAFSLTARHYRIPAGVVEDGGGAQHPTMELLGAQWISELNRHSYLRLHAEGAMGGRSTGYMQILLGGGYRWPVGNGTQLKLQAAAGPAGGGKVDTGGGMLFEAGLALEQPLSRWMALEVGLSRVQAPSRSFKANSLDLKLTHRFDLPEAGTVPTAADVQSFDRRTLRTRWVHQRYGGASSNWRTKPSVAVDNMGIALDNFLPTDKEARRWFLSGQGIAAYGGQAGAYMTGLFGAGVHQRLGGPWFGELEGLVGAAGGGGLATGNGLVVQANASVGYQLNPGLSVLASLGQMAAPHGDFRVRVMGLNLAWQFTGLTQK